ncbi:hypothetical protein AMATHDRAFT_193065 [Amanita thiersii Skay4041]|uniref:Uncharacterized protein n=1 Tax=Amanita thiersii Skay4041 TaxID=703135 RepID=A0A2A9NQQ6_9AGAR|nr:hypothetical protein AMATHDRAFT_193065 [Amanita thiersii Skay4041]
MLFMSSSSSSLRARARMGGDGAKRMGVGTSAVATTETTLRHGHTEDPKSGGSLAAGTDTTTTTTITHGAPVAASSSSSPTGASQIHNTQSHASMGTSSYSATTTGTPSQSLDDHSSSAFSVTDSGSSRTSTRMDPSEWSGSGNGRVEPQLGPGRVRPEGSGAKDKNKANGHAAAADEDWARDVRWLVTQDNDKQEPASSARISSGSRFTKRKSLPSSLSSPSSTNRASTTTTTTTTTTQNANYLPRKTPKLLKSMSKANPSIMMNMTALMEEDEDALATGGIHADGPQSNVILVHSDEAGMGTSTPPSPSKPRSPFSSYLSPNEPTTGSERLASVTASGSTSRSTNSSSGSSQSRMPTTHNTNNNYHNHNDTPSSTSSNLRHRRSRSLDLEHDQQAKSSSSSLRSHSRSRINGTSVSELAASLPLPSGELPSNGTPGYTSLMLPRAPPPVSLSAKSLGKRAEVNNDGRVDLTMSGAAQTTMATVEVMQGLGVANVKKGFMSVFGLKKGLGRRQTLPSHVIAPRGESGAGKMRSRSEDVGMGGLGSYKPLEFTSYRKPPEYIPGGSVLVQVWAVGVDGTDARLVGLRLGSRGTGHTSASTARFKNAAGKALTRSGSLRRKFFGSGGGGDSGGGRVDHHQQVQPQVGFIPGRSFVGRVLECGWEVRGDVVRKGEWVVGLLDVKKCGALAEFIVVDKRRIHRVPHPKMEGQPSISPISPSRRSSRASSSKMKRTTSFGLTLEELALLPLCGIPAYRAVRTFMYAFSSTTTKEPDTPVIGSPRSASSSRTKLSNHEVAGGRKRRALVLRGHDGIGAIAAQLLIARGWCVYVHVPCPYPANTGDGEHSEAELYMESVEARAREWGCEEVIFDDGLEENGDEGRGAVVRILDRLRGEGDVIDAVLDTVGGKEVWEAAERLLKCSYIVSSDSSSRITLPLGGGGKGGSVRKKGQSQFTTLIGDSPHRVVPNAGDLFRAGLRSLKMGGKPSGGGGGNSKEDPTADQVKGSHQTRDENKVGYAWVSLSQDVDWEGQDVAESIGAVLRLALEEKAKPWVGGEHHGGRNLFSELSVERYRVVSFERAAQDVFVDYGPLGHGATSVIKIVG